MEPNLHLKNERERRGWSQSRVADEIGTSDKNVGRWERGEVYPSPYFREKLCILFGKSAHELGFVKDAVQQNGLQRAKPEEPLPAILYDPTVPPLPNEGRGLVGRLELLDALAEQLCSGKCVVLSGLPGVGKTAIAVTLLHQPRVSAVFSDGVLWAGLGPIPTYSNNSVAGVHCWGWGYLCSMRKIM